MFKTEFMVFPPKPDPLPDSYLEDGIPVDTLAQARTQEDILDVSLVLSHHVESFSKSGCLLALKCLLNLTSLHLHCLHHPCLSEECGVG